MASLLIQGKDLSVGDVLLLPMGRTATVESLKPIRPRSRYVSFKTEHGWSRVELGYELMVQARVG
jgi:hypothetical protein